MSDLKGTQARVGRKLDTSWYEKFFDELAKFPNVSRACRRSGATRKSAYEHKGKYKEFAESWDNALQVGLDRWEEEAARRAFKGVERGVYYQGEKVDTIKEYSDTLAVTMLKAHRPEKYRERMHVETSGDMTINVTVSDDNE